MKSLVRTFPAVVAVILCICACRREARLIPKDDMAHIYADMLVADQWLNENPTLRRQADTTLFYEPVFNRYGYTTADYLYSVRHYLDDPERFSRVLKKSSALLGARVRKIKSYQDAMERIRSNAPRFYWERIDSFRFSLYDSLMMMRDSIVAVSDSLAACDSLTVACDSLTVACDSLTAACDSSAAAVADSIAVLPDTLSHRGLPVPVSKVVSGKELKME